MGGSPTRTALILSLGLNILALGVIGGAGIAWLRLETNPPHHPLRDAGQDLLRPDRRRYDAMLKAFGQTTRPTRQAAQRYRKAAARLFVQPNFDAAEVSAALAKARNTDLQLRSQLESTIVEFAGTLSQKERASLASGLAKGGPFRQPPPPKTR